MMYGDIHDTERPREILSFRRSSSIPRKTDLIGVNIAKGQCVINMKCLCVLGCWSCGYLGYHKHFLWQEIYVAFGEVMSLDNK